jgi:hypothetical protein
VPRAGRAEQVLYKFTNLFFFILQPGGQTNKLGKLFKKIKEKIMYLWNTGGQHHHKERSEKVGLGAQDEVGPLTYLLEPAHNRQ